MALHEFTRRYLEEFLAVIRPVEEAYRNDSFGYVAVKGPEGFVVLQGSLYLNPVPRAHAPFKFETENICAAHHHFFELQCSREELIEQICSGSFTMPEGPLLFPGNDGNQHGAAFHPFHPRGTLVQSRINVLSLYGAQRRNFSDVALDWELRGAPRPYESLLELMNEYEAGVPLGGTNTVEVVAYNVARIHTNSHVSGEKAVIEVRLAQGLDPDRFSVGFRILEQGAVVRRSSLMKGGFIWAKDENCQCGIGEIPVPRAAVVQCTAVYAGIAQHYYQFGDPKTFQNPRRAAYETFDQKIEALDETLAQVGKRGQDARYFESAISWVFWMLRFSPAHLGATPRTQDAPDLVFCTPKGHFAVVECTTGLLKADNKLPKLHSRAQALRQSLDASNAGHLHVLAIMVTAMTEGEVAVELAQAHENNIHVIAREGINQLIDRTMIPLDPDELYAEMERLIQASHAVDPLSALVEPE